jgi:hypothetical protein
MGRACDRLNSLGACIAEVVVGLGGQDQLLRAEW